MTLPVVIDARADEVRGIHEAHAAGEPAGGWAEGSDGGDSGGRSGEREPDPQGEKLLIANKQAMDHEAVEDMHDDLVVALQKLSAAFKLD